MISQKKKYSVFRHTAEFYCFIMESKRNIGHKYQNRKPDFRISIYDMYDCDIYGYYWVSGY